MSYLNGVRGLSFIRVNNAESAKSESFKNDVLSGCIKEVVKMNAGTLLKVEGEFADYVRELDYKNIGPDVYAGEMQDSLLSDISAVCRRAFKKKDVIVYVKIEPDDEDYEEGLVFTTTGIFHWTDSGSNVTGIKYSEIKNVDYDETDIIIERGDETTRISLGEDAKEKKYPRRMYSFIMDILDYDGADATVVSGEV